MSVKRTEDSLKKLKQRGRRSHDTVGGTASVSDDDKIRLQLSLDVDAFVDQVSWCSQIDHIWLLLLGREVANSTVAVGNTNDCSTTAVRGGS